MSYGNIDLRYGGVMTRRGSRVGRDNLLLVGQRQRGSKEGRGNDDVFETFCKLVLLLLLLLLLRRLWRLGAKMKMEMEILVDNLQN